jgi:hypothetical protein
MTAPSTARDDQGGQPDGTGWIDAAVGQQLGKFDLPLRKDLTRQRGGLGRILTGVDGDGEDGAAGQVVGIDEGPFPEPHEVVEGLQGVAGLDSGVDARGDVAGRLPDRGKDQFVPAAGEVVV